MHREVERAEMLKLCIVIEEGILSKAASKIAFSCAA